MNAAEQELLNAARTCAEAARVDDEVAHWRHLQQQGDGALANLVVAALNAYPADAPPAPEVVQSVDDLRDGETVHVGTSDKFVHFTVTITAAGETWLDDGPGSRGIGPPVVECLVAAGAVTRPPAPEPDPAEVERLAEMLSRADDAVYKPEASSDFPLMARARYLLRSGEITLRDPS